MEQNKKCNACQSCLMPFSKDTGVRESDIYCSLCYKDGKLCYESMRKNGTPYLLAKLYTWMIRFAPRWKNKK